LRVVFFGTPPFSAYILEKLIEHEVNIVGVVTRPDRPQGRSKQLLPSAVKSLVQENWPKLPLFQPEKASTEIFAEVLKDLRPDLFIVVAYGEIIKKNLLDIPTILPINVHASLLPKYRGAAPIQRAIMNGEKETGITIMEMVLEMDAGDMLHVAKTPIAEDMTFDELEEKLCHLSVPALLKVLEKIELGTLIKTPQDASQATFAPKITSEDRVLDWSKRAEEIHNQVRALSPFPGAFAFVEEGMRLGIKRTQKVLDASGQPGQTLIYDKSGWVVACGIGAVSLLEVQMEGKKVLAFEEFFRGNPHPPKIKIV
jgi:methionyl-tRNA formyltransferase